MPRHQQTPMTNRRQTGLTLIELMVALAIGAFLMIGAITVFVQSRATFRATETVARLQETARFALDFLEPDIRMAHYWGLTSRTYLIRGRRAPTDPAGLGPGTCGQNWTINLDQAVQGSNNGYGFGCAVKAPRVAVDTSDTLVVRRARADVTPLTAGTLYIESTRSQLGQIFAGTAVPPGYGSATSEAHQLIVNGYFVARDPTTGAPSLRMKTLGTGGVITEQEVITGIEDLQIQFGVDTDAPGTPMAPNRNRGSIDRWVNADDPLIDPASPAFDPNVEILAVRIWLRARSDQTDPAYKDTTTYVYADQNVAPIDDGYHRVVVSKTIYLRNARPAS
jgi:type IV pilus assembly protein PilW